MPLINRYHTVLILLLAWNFSLRAQTVPYLERTVSINSNGQTLAELFRQISDQTGVVFSYSQTFNDKQKASIHCTRRPLRLVLAELLKESGCTYKSRDKYLILKCDNKPLPPPSVITGYIYDAEDSSVIANASIYVKQTRHSAQSNAYGYFSLSFANQLPSISVSFARENYYDSTLVIYNKQKQEVVIYLYPRFHQKDTVVESLPIPEKDSVMIVTRTDTVLVPQRRFFSNFWKPLKTFNTNLRNISDTLFSEVAISLVPYISTNRLLSINTVNKVSFNVLAGYSKGVRGYEIGGLVNIDNGDVYYGQMAGLANIVSGESKGAQIAGILNFNDRTTSGAQVAGIANVDRGNVKGAQIAGILNVNNQATQAAQLAGILNIDRGSATGAQVAGIGNISRQQTDGAQVAGIFNLCRHHMSGIQLSGIMNDGDTVRGVQLSGIVNRARTLQGVQLGLWNVADTSSGVSIGFFNYVKKGYRKLEIGSDELLFGNAAFATGTSSLYTIFTAGVNYANTALVTYGYGAGTCLTIGKRLRFCATVSAHQIQHTGSGTFRNNLLARAFAGIEYKALSRFSIGAGPTVNFYNPNAGGNEPSDLLFSFPGYRWGESSTGNSTKMWVGARLYVKFF